MTNDSVKAAAERFYAEAVEQEVPMSLRAHVTIGPSLRITEFRGEGHFWLVPLLLRGREIGWMHVDRRLQVIRYSVRVSDPAQIDELPTATTEMTAAQIRRKAAAQIGPDAQLASGPELVYLGFETRVAWHCRVRLARKQEFSVFVTPQAAWKER